MENKSNIEIKAKIGNLNIFINKVSKLDNVSPEKDLRQRDVFFHAKKGRLKLRITNDNAAYLIQYNRPDKRGPKKSTYSMAFIVNSDELIYSMRQAGNIIGEVNKTRTLFTCGQTRIHCDQVKDLGNFMELEVVLSGEQSVEDGEKIAEELMKKLDIESRDLITCSYFDLLYKK